MPPSAIAPAKAAKPLALALPGLAMLGLAWSLALVAPPPDAEGGPATIEDPVLSCDAVRARIAAGETDFYAVLPGHLEEIGREGAVRLVCDGGGDLVANANTNVTGTPGLFRAHVEDDGTPRLVMSCLQCDSLAPRRVVPRDYIAQWVMRVIVMALGIAGAFAFVAGWRRRPFEPLRDLTRGRAPASSHALARPSNDRVRVDGHVHQARVLGKVGDSLGPTASEERSALILPGSGASYRDGAGELPYVVGPASLATLPVRAGERAPIADGDRLELPGMPPLRVELPVPGTIARFFFAASAHARFVGRAPTALTKLHATLARVAGIGAIVFALLDLPYGLALGVVVLAVALVLAVTLPRQAASTFETRVPYAALSELTITEASGWLSVAHRGRPITWLPLPEEGELARAVERELRGLTTPSA